MKMMLSLSSILLAHASRIVDESSQPLMTQDIIDAINSNPASKWKAGFNTRFANMTVGEARLMMVARTDNIASLPVMEHDLETLAAAPDSYDPRVSRPNCTGPVMDQGFCGSCWAFGATEAITDRLCMSTGKFLQLAPLDLTTCDDGLFAGEDGCQGGQLEGAWNYAKRTGLVDEECYPYLKSQGGPVPTCEPDKQPCLPESKFIKTPRCTKKCVNGKDWEASKHKLKSVYSLRASQMMAELATNGPVESAFTVYGDFPTYKQGVYHHQSGSMLGGHAIKVIGYGSEDGTDYWLVQNSWTTTWGDGGYFKIRRGTNECGIESSFVAGSF